MQTVNNMLILGSGEVAKPEYRAAAVAALKASQSVSIPAIGLSFVKVGEDIRVIDVSKGEEVLVKKSPEEVVDAVVLYQTPDRILAFLSV